MAMASHDSTMKPQEAWKPVAGNDEASLAVPNQQQMLPNQQQMLPGQQPMLRNERISPDQQMGPNHNQMLPNQPNQPMNNLAAEDSGKFQKLRPSPAAMPNNNANEPTNGALANAAPAAAASAVGDHNLATAGETNAEHNLTAEEPMEMRMPDGVSMEYKGNIETRGTHVSLLGRPYDVKNVPSAPPAITDTTPDVWFHTAQSGRKEAAEHKEAERLQALEKKKGDKKEGVGHKISKFFSDASAHVGKSMSGATESLETKAWEGNIRVAKERMLKYWPNQPQEGLVCEFDAYGLHNNVPIRGHILLTHTSFLFLGKGLDGKLVIVEDIPLADVLSYSKGVTVQCFNRNRRWVIDVPMPFVKADALQLYTRQGVLFQFNQFSSSLPDLNDGHSDIGPMDRFINYLDHMWREARLPGEVSQGKALA